MSALRITDPRCLSKAVLDAPPSLDYLCLQWQCNSDAFPSSAAFDAINNSLQSDDAERKDAVKKGNAVFAFTLKNKEGSAESWYIDLKDKGEVGKGDAPVGKKADGMSG